jgi:hypothetical protein
MRGVRFAYALAAVLFVAATAAWAALLSHEDLGADLTARPINIEIQQAAYEEVRICCKDDWERFDRAVRSRRSKVTGSFGTSLVFIKYEDEPE